MLNITLLGQPQIRLDGDPLPIKSRKAQALLFYLVTEQRAHSREKIAGIFWEDMALERARNNLSGILTKDLRPLRDTYVVMTPDSLTFNTDSNHTIDIHAFQNRFRLQNAPLETLEALAGAYQGQFLEDFKVPTVPEFEFWRNGQQERFHSLVYPIFNTLIWHHHQQEDWNQGIQLAQRLINARPTDEKARRLIMLLLSLNDQRTEAMVHYETYYEMLTVEGNRPTQETIALYGAIMRNQVDKTLIDRYTQPRYTPTLTLLPTDEPADDAIPFQAERQVPHFVGRGEELTAITNAITDPEGSNIICLEGMGGVGKTTLAIRLAHDLREGFADGVLWAKLAASDPFSVLESWAQAYDLDYSQLADLESRAAAFRDFLEDKQTLLILDDVRETAQVKPLLPNGEKCTVIITTRDAAIANFFNAQAIPLSVFEDQTSQDLLRELLTPEQVENEPEAATEIADLLEHLPLALEITAKRLRSRTRTLAQTADRLRTVKSRLDELNFRDIAVRATFEDSWMILTEEQQRFFAYLGVFGEREFQIDALRTITELDNFTTEDILFDLVEYSLVSTDSEWFWLHSLLADFAGEKLETLGEADEAQQRMAGYYLDFAIEHQGDPTPLNNHWHNIMASVQFAYTHQMRQACIDYAEYLYDAFFTQGHFSDARAVYPLALEAARALDQQETLVDLLCSYARACVEQGDEDEARTYLNESLTISQHLEYPRGIGESLLRLGRITLNHAQRDSDYKTAQDYLHQSREIYEELEDHSRIAETYILEWKIAYYIRMDMNIIRNLAERSLEYYELVNDIPGKIQVFESLATTELTSGNFVKAAEYCSIARQLCLEIEDQRNLVVILFTYAEVHRKLENYTAAIETINQSIELAEHLGDRRTFAFALLRKGFILNDLQEYNQGLDALQKCLPLFESLKIHQGIVSLYYILGEVYQKLHQFEESCQQLRQARKLINEDSPFVATLDQKLSDYDCI